ncbi:MAG: AAA family ATPase [Gammaproteobacteria bacterium]|nr:AAA family ATPase [Gammaproteobacteria bacterium]MBL6999188.1 AAA family ATPase [Gammaproteobacteria bacterium]
MQGVQNLTSNPAANRAKKSLARVIAISSGKGGVGKSSISLNLAIELARLKNKVCLFDADTNLGNINIMTGLTPDASLHNLLRGEKDLQQVLLEGPGGIKILPAASGIMDFVSFNPAQQNQMLDQLKILEQQFDYVLIDTAAGINETVLSFLHAAPETIITITTEPTSLTDAFSLLKVLRKQGFDRPVQVVINKAATLQSAKDALSRFNGALKKYLGLQVIAPGYVLEDYHVARAIMRQQPFTLSFPKSPASCCVRNFAHKVHDRVLHNETSLTDFLQAQQSPAVSSLRATETGAYPWMETLIKSMQTAPFNEVEELMSTITRVWMQRLDSETRVTGQDNEAGFKAAIHFASRLK